MHVCQCFLYAAGLYIPVTLAYDLDKCKEKGVVFIRLDCQYDNNDISYNKTATQSQTDIDIHNRYGASKAVDRNIATCTKTKPIGLNDPDKTVWWKVDLGRVSSIYSIHIQFKSFDGYVDRQKGRLAGFSLYVSNSDVNSLDDIKKTTLCYKDGPELPPLNLTKECMEYGRYVIFYNERLNGIAYPEEYEVYSVFTELCEVNIKGCSNSSVYGINCDIPCPTNCKDSTCHIENGACFLCKPGWTGLDCDTKCREGWYGMNCTKQCVGHCKDGASCNHVSGHCDRGCTVGWKGDFCDEECKGGSYGYNCVHNCSGHCLNNSPCNKQTGLCDRGCDAGYTNNNCSKECLPGYFGIDCSRKCSGHCINNEPCDHVSGVCPSGCQDGFVGTHCNKSCNEGYFGTNCSRLCSPNCQHGQCGHTNGSCSSCVEGWMGGNCTTACFKSYGENCQYPCSLHCYNNTCNTHNGRCLIGCKDGFYGEWCAKGNVLKIQSISSSIMLASGLSVSILINIIFTVCGIFLWRRIKSSKVTLSGNLLSCWKKSLYQDIVVKNDENSTYQELDVSNSTYQNTAIP